MTLMVLEGSALGLCPPTGAPSLRPNGGTGAAVSSQPTAPTRRRSDESGPPSLGGATAVRVVFGTRVVGVTLVHRPWRRAASGSRPRARAPTSVGIVHTIAPVKAAAVDEGIQHDRDARARKAVSGERQGHG